MRIFHAERIVLGGTPLFVLMSMLGGSIASPAQVPVPIQLLVDDATPSDGHVHFKPSSCDVEPAPVPLNLQQMSRGETPAYSLFVDISQTSMFYGSFVYEFYVARKSTTPPAQFCAFRVQANPSGTFVDQIADISFHVKEGSAPQEDGTVTIPLHNSSYKQPILQARPPTPFANVNLAGRYPVPIKISNLLPSLPVSMNGITATADNPGYWQVPPQAALHFSMPGATELQAGQTLDTGIEVTLIPNRWRALGASIFPIAPDKAQETVHLSINFNTPGGIPGTLEVPLPVRFKPSFWNLAVAVLIGALIGSGMGAILPKKDSVASLAWYKAMVVAVGLGIIAEALGLILVNGNSEFRLLGFELDPYQLLPASMVGALIGLVGFRSADDFLGMFKKGTS